MRSAVVDEVFVLLVIDLENGRWIYDMVRVRCLIVKGKERGHVNGHGGEELVTTSLVGRCYSRSVAGSYWAGTVTSQPQTALVWFGLLAKTAAATCNHQTRQTRRCHLHTRNPF